MLYEKILHIYTDGSCYSNPRRGGIGVRFVYEDYPSHEQVELDFNYSGYVNATNNEMELYACIQAFKECLSFKNISWYNHIIVYTDSKYLVENYKNAMYRWRKNGWTKVDGSPVLNVKYWKEFLKYMKKLYDLKKHVDIRKIKGHSKNTHNKVVDKLAKKSAKNAINKPLGYTDVRKKISHKSVEKGSVKMEGQRVSIRIITSQRLPHHRVWKYKYEVISKASKYYKNVDFIFYTEVLRVGHGYRVRLNTNNGYPCITKKFEDIGTKCIH